MGVADSDEIMQARAVITTLCGWHVTPQREDTITVDTTGDNVVFLPTKKLVDVLDLTVDGKPVAPEHYAFSEDGMLHLDHRVPAGFRKLTATIIHGYASAPEVEALVEKLAARATKPAESYSVGGISVGAPGSVMPQSTEWRIIDQHKLGPMP